MKVDPVAVTDGATVSKGAAGEPVRPCSVEIDAVLPRTPWSGDIEVRYTCTDLRAGFSYKEVFHVTSSCRFRRGSSGPRSSSVTSGRDSASPF